jgi:hypothetical protein
LIALVKLGLWLSMELWRQWNSFDRGSWRAY